MTTIEYGSHHKPWLVCEDHGIAFSQCWSCNKPAGLCSYGDCDQHPTHVGASRGCCQPHARYLADINGDGTIAPIRRRVHIAVANGTGRIHAATAVEVEGRIEELGRSACGAVDFAADSSPTCCSVDCRSCLRVMAKRDINIIAPPAA